MSIGAMELDAAGRYVARVSPRNQFQLLRQSLLYFFVLGLTPLFFWWRFGAESVYFAIAFAVISYGLIFSVHMVVHARYLRASAGVDYLFDPARREIVVATEHQHSAVGVDEILDVERVLTPPIANGTLRWFPWQSYCHLKITTEHGDAFAITCLHAPDLSLPFSFPESRETVTIFPWIDRSFIRPS